MLSKLSNSRDSESAASRLRQKRMQRFIELLPVGRGTVRILDVGGTSWSWQKPNPLPPGCEVTVLNVKAETGPLPPGFRSLAGDARRMPHVGDHEYDMAYSNSVIEHVGTLHDQIAMAAEIRRTCRGYFVQTPYRHFPIEPHFLIPGWQYLPVALRRRFLQKRKLGWMAREPDALRAQAEVEQVRLITQREMRLLFPDGQLWCERIGPFVKSLVAWKRP